MAKRTKLLSLVVAAIMCFAIGFAVTFSTSKAEAAVEIPDAPYTENNLILDWNSTGQGCALALDTGISTDWFVIDYTIPAGTTNSTATANVVVSTGYLFNGANAGDVDGTSAKATIDVSTLYDNEGATAKRVRIAVDLVNGVVYVAEGDGEYAEAATYENWAYVSSATSKFVYLTFGASSSKKVENFMLYTEDGIITSGWRAGNPGNTNNGGWYAKQTNKLALPTATAPAGAAKSYAMNDNFNLLSTNATTSDWIIFEYTLSGDSTTTTAHNGMISTLSTDGSKSSATKNEIQHGYLYGNATTPRSHDLMPLLLNATDGADTHVKLMVNTITGRLVVEKDGAVNTWLVHTGASAFTAATRYFYITRNTGTMSATLKDLVCYDGNGVDLGVTTTMSVVVDPGLPATAVKPAVDNAYYVDDSFNIKSATPTTADFIIFEYTVKAGTTYSNGSSAPQNGLITTLSTNGTVTDVDTAGSVDGMLYNFTSSPTVGTAYKWFVTDSNDAAMKIAVNTNTGSIYVQKDGGAWAEYKVHTGASALTGEDRYFGVTTNVKAGQGITGNIEDLVCYDSDGRDLGVVTSLVGAGTIAEDVIEGEANWVEGGRYLINVSYVIADGTPAADKALSSVPALKYGAEATTLKFTGGGGNLQLFYPLDNGKEEGFDFSEYVNEWYLVKAGTIFGSVILSEDIIIRFNDASVQIFKADHEFAINYANVDGAVNNNATSRKFTDEVVLTAPTMEGKTFYGWDKEIPAYTYGDVTVTAEWYDVAFAGIYASITESVAMTYIVEYTGYTDLYVEASMVYDGENAIVKSGALVDGKFVFDGVLPQHLGDVISLKVTNGEGGEELLAIELSVKDYLDEVIAAESFEDYNAEKLVAFKAVAEDLLYYGAAAQLFTGHDVENLPADLANATDSIGAVESVYAKEGVKDEAYAWKTAKLVYAENIKLCFEIAAPEGAALKVVIANGAEVVTVTEFTANAKGNYEFEVVVAATEFDSALTLTIYDGEEAKGEVLTYSVNSYISMISEMGVSADELTLIERVWCYGQSVKAFTEIA